MSVLTKMRGVAAVLLLAGSGLLHASIFTYTNTAASGTNWFNPTNWSPNQVPGSSDTAVIAGKTVGLTNSANIGTLNFSGGTLTAPFGLTIISGGNWTGGVLHGQFTVAGAANFYLTDTGGTLDLPGTTLFILGTVIWEGGTLRGNSATVISNSGTWFINGVNDQFNNAYGGTPSFIDNTSGSFVVQNAAAQTVTFSGVAFTNNYNVDSAVFVMGGTMLFEGGGYLNGGFFASLGATNRFDQLPGNNTPFITGPNFRCTGPGVGELTGGTILLANDPAGLALLGGTVTPGPNFQSSGAITNLTINGSTLAGTNTLTGTMNWLAGGLSGVFNISSSGVLNLSGAGSVNQYAALTNSGHIYWNGSGNWYLYNNNSANNGLINNLAAGVIDVQCNNEMYYQYGFEWFNNSGLFRKTTSTNTTTINIIFTNTATGTVLVQTGEMDFARPNGSFGGVFQAANGTTLHFNNGGTLSGSFTAGYGADIGFDGGIFSELASASFGGAGTVELRGGTLTLPDIINPSLQLNGGALNLPAGFQGGTITNLTVTGVTLTGSNTVTGVLNLNGNLNGPLVVASGGVVNWTSGTMSGGVTISPGGVLNIAGSSEGMDVAAMTNAGTINWTSAPLTILYGNTFYNLAGGVFNIECDAPFYFYNETESINNAGLVQKFGTAGQTTIYPELINSGVVVAQSGTLAFNDYYLGQNSVLGGVFLADAGAELLFGDGGNLTGNFTAASGGNIVLQGGTFTPSPTLVFNGPGTNTMTGGTITLASSTIPNLQLTGGTVFLAPGFQGGAITNLVLNNASIAGTNTVTGTLSLSGSVNGPLTVASNATLNLGGIIYSNLTLMPGSTLNWSGGSDYASLTIPSNAVVNLTGPGTVGVYAPLTNAGTVNWNGGNLYVYPYYTNYYYYYYYTNVAIYNLPGAVFNLQSNNLDGYGSGTFNNTGLLRQWLGPGTNYLNLIFNNTGVVDVQTGTLLMQGPVQNSNMTGTYLVEAGATLNFSGGGYLTGQFSAAGGATMDFSGGTFTNTTSTALDGVGVYNLDGGTLNLLYDLPANLNLLSGYLDPGPNFQNGSIANLTLNGVGLAGPNTNTVTGVLNLNGSVAGPLIVAGGATLTVTGDISAPVTVQPGGTFTWSGQTLHVASPVTVQGGAVWNLAPSNNAYLHSPVTNFGTINWSGGSLQLYNQYNDYFIYGYTYYDAGSIFNLPAATFNILTDQPILPYYGAEFINNDGTFRKSGTTGASSIGILFTNTGTIDVENGTLQFNNTLSQNNGTWDIAVGGLMLFAGQAPLPNILNVTVSPNFVPGMTNFIPIVDYPSYSGAVSTFNAPAGGASWQLNYGGNALSLIITNQALPTIGIISPANNAGFTAPAGITLSAVGTVVSSEIIGFGGNGAGWTTNRSPSTSEGPSISGNVLHLTEGGEYEGGSAFYNVPQNISAFTASFTYHNSTPFDNYDPADGFAFVLQNKGLSAVGGYGLNLGFGGSPGITPGAAVTFNLYVGYGTGSKYANNAATYQNSDYQSVSPVNLDGTNPLNVTISYDGTTLTEILVDSVTGAAFTNTYVVNLVSDVGGGTAYVGFSGGSGSGVSVQDITDFTFSSTTQNNSDIASVQFYDGTTLLGAGTLQGPSFNRTWNPVGVGNYTLTAVASDGQGNTATSAPVNITVYAAGTQPVNYTWTGAINTDWFTAGNWTPNGVPGAPDNVSITNGGMVVLSHATSANSVTLGSGTIGGAGKLTVTNVFTWLGGAITNSLAIPTNAALVINTPNTVNLPGAVLVNQGTVQWIRGNIVGNPSTVITNGSGALWQIQTDNTLQLGVTVGVNNGLFVNNGVVRKIITTGSTYLTSQNFINNGLVDVQTGALYFGSGGTLAGVYNTAAGSTIRFYNGSFTNSSPPAFTGQGADYFTGGTLTMLHDVAPKLQLTGGSVILGPVFQNAGSITNLTISGSTLLGTNTVTGTFNLLTGSAYNGVLTVTPAGLLVLGASNAYYGSVLLQNLILNNSGEVLWLGGSIDCYGSSMVTNNNLWQIQGSQQGGWSIYGSPFVNNGLIKQITAGTSYIENTVFINNGTIDAEAGTIDLASGGTFAGAYNAAAGATIAFAGGSNIMAGLPNFTGQGAFTFTYGTLVMNNDIDPALQLTGGTVVLGPAFQNGGKINNLVLSGASLAGTNTVTGVLTFMTVNNYEYSQSGFVNGPLTVGSNATLNILTGTVSFLAGGITNFGSVICSGNGSRLSLGGATPVYIVNNGLWLDQDATEFTGSQNDAFINNGIYRKEGSTGESDFEIPLVNNGLFDLHAGDVELDDGGVLGGIFNVAASSTLDLYEGNFAAGVPPAVFTGTGPVQFDSATITLTNDVIPNLPLNGGTVLLGPNFQHNGTITNLTLTGATLGGTNIVSGTLNLSADSQVTGSLTVLTNALLTISGNSEITFAQNCVLVNQGVVDWTGGQIYTSPNALITNFGLWLVETDNQFYNEEYGYYQSYYYNYPNTSFNNPGTFAKTTTSGTTAFYGIAFLNSGTLDIQSGTLDFSAYDYATNSVNYAQTGATLDFGVSAPNLAGQLVLSTNVTLDGTLEMDLLNGYTPGLGDEVPLITYGAGSQTAFANLVLPSLTNMTWDVETGSAGVTLRVVPTLVTSNPFHISGLVMDDNDHAVPGVTVYATETGATNLIQNGSFEMPSTDGAAYLLFAPGSTNIPGWTVIGPPGDNVAVSISSYYYNYGLSEDGVQFFDPTGTTGGAGLSQTFATVPGMTYELVFYHGSLNHYSLNAVLGVTIGTNYYTFGETDGTYYNFDWRRVQIPFTAPSSQTTLTFSELTGFNADDSVVDNVQVIPPGLGTVAQGTTDATGSYQITVPGGTYQVGVDGLPNAGYNNVQEVTVVVGGPNNQNGVANFFPVPLSGGQFFAVTTSVNPPALGNSSGNQSGIHLGAPVTVSVTQNASPLPYFFSGWTENGVLESTNLNYSFTAFRNRALVANFALPGLLVASSNNPPADGVVSGAGVYTYNNTSVLTAFPFTGYKFINWTEGGLVVSTANPLDTLVLTNHLLVANYGDANPSHVVTITNSPLGQAIGTGAGSYTNGQTAIITVPAALTNAGAFYIFQGFNLGGSPVTSASSFSKSFSTFDPTNLAYVANYQSNSLQPQIISVNDNYPGVVPATTGFLLTFQFDRSMRTNPAPLVILTNSAANAVQAMAGSSGLWTTTAISNDTYQTPGITFGNGMDGNVKVFISRVQDIYGHALAATNVINLVVRSTPPPAPVIAITSPTNGTLLTNNQPFVISGPVTSTNSITEVDLYANGVPLGVVSNPSLTYSFPVNGGLAGGSYALQAVAIDAGNLSATSAVMHITVQSPGTTLIDFEALAASAGPVGGTLLSNYLAGFGVKATNVTTGTSLVAANDQVFLGGGVVRASSGDNILAQTGANGAVSYTLLFAQPYASVSWVRPRLLAGTTGASLPGWRAHIFDSLGNDLGSIGENALASFADVPAARFTLLGRDAMQNLATNIVSIRFDGNNQGVSALSTLPLDDLLLAVAATNTTLAVNLTSPGGTTYTAPAQVVLKAAVSDTAGTVSQVSFYEGSNFVAAVAPVAGVAWLTNNNLGAGSYGFTAVASDSVGAVGSSAALPVVVTGVPGLSVINFDLLNTSAGAAGGAALSNYLSTNFGVKLANVTVGTAMEAVNGGLVTGSGGAAASSPPNYFTQAGLNQPVSFTLVFKSPLQAFGFTRVALLAGAGGVSHPQWTATALDANGAALGSAGEGLILSATNVPARSFVLTGLTGDGITAVRFDSDSQKTAAFSAVLLDDLILNTNAVTPALAVAVSSPAANAVLTALQPVTLGAVVTDAGLVDHVSFYAGAALLGSAGSFPYTFNWTTAQAGSYLLRAQVVDVSGVAEYSGPVPVVVGVGGNQTVVNFDALNAARSAVTGTVLSNYLQGFGMTVGTNLTPGTVLAVENQTTVNGGGAVAASSPPNILTQLGSGGPVSYTVSFAALLTNFSFTRPELLASPFVSQAAWTATAYDAAGVALAAVGEGLTGSYTNVGAQAFSLSGPGIARVQFASFGSGLTTFNAVVADDFVLTTNAAGVFFPPAVAITNPVAGLQIVAPPALTVGAQALDGAGIVSVSFYANGLLFGTAAASPYSAQLVNPGAGGYALTAVALDNNGLSRTSPAVNVTVLPSAFQFAIVTQPASQTAAAGSSATFSVTTTGTGAVAYQWYQNNTALTGQTGSTLTLFPVVPGDAGNYTVTATSGGVTLTSSPAAVLTVAQPPAITTPPQGQTVAAGADVVLSVGAGPGLFNCQWLLNGSAIPGATNSTYSILAAQPLNSGNYQVVVGNAAAFVVSASAEVVVQSGGGTVQTADNFADRISINPLLGPVMGNNQNATLEAGETNQIAGKPDGKSIWYTWTASFTGVISLTTQGSDFDTLLAVYTGTNVGKLTLVAADDDSGGFFTSLVTFNVTAGTIYQMAVAGYNGASGNVVLGMPSGTAYRVLNPSAGSSVPVITKGPTNQLVQAGAKVTLSVTATSPTALTYQWNFQGVPVGSGGTGSSLVITNFQAGSVGLYDVLVANAVGSVDSAPASLQIAPLNQPGAGGSSQDKFLDAADLAGPAPAPAQSREPAAGGGDSRGFSVSQVFSTVGATKEPGEPDHCGQAGGASQWFIYTAPAAGTLDVNTAGSGFNTILAIYTGTGASFASLVPQGCGFTTNYQTQGQPNVVLPGVVKGTRFFIAVDGYGRASGMVQLHIGLGAPPALVTPPASQFAVAGSNATFNVTAIGSTNFGYQWKLNGVNLARATNASYTVTNAQAGAVGSYTVVVSNVVGVVTSAPPATLTLQYMPLITVQPTNDTVLVGQKAGLGVTVIGVNVKTNLLQYQWYYSNNLVVVPVARATNAGLAFPAANYTNNGNYFVIVTNRYGAATSTVAALTVRDVNAPAVAFSTPANNFSTNGNSVTVTGTASDNVAVAQVRVEVGQNGFQTATGTTKWTNVVSLVPGTNVITAQSMDPAGNVSASATLHLIYLASSRLVVLTNGNGNVTSTGGATNGATLIIGRNYTVTAKPGSGNLFSNWLGGTVTGPLTNFPGGSNLTFLMFTNMVLQASFVPNPFPAVAGVYNGLFYPTNGVTEASSGYLNVTISSNSTGAYSAKLLLDGGSNLFSGTFDLTGNAQTNLVRPGKTPVGVTLALDFNPADAQLTGAVSNAASGWNSVIQADRAVFNAANNPAVNYAGQFTLLLPPDTNAPLGTPDGYGYAAVTNSLAGNSTLGGALADGTPFLWSVPVAQGGGIPFYLSLYGGKGSVLGWIYFTNQPPQTISTNSTVNWIKPAVVSTLYPGGFTNLSLAGVLGSPYTNTIRAGEPVLNLTNATLILSNGNLAGGALIYTNLNITNNTLTNLAGAAGLGQTNRLGLSVNTNNGVVTVTFQATGEKTNTLARGAMLQNQTNALGAFPGTNQTGSFILH